MNALPSVACKGCGKMISWVSIAETGKRMPINQVAEPNGTVFYANGGWHVRSRHIHPPPATSLYVSHFATCPAASKFRGTRRR